MKVDTLKLKVCGMRDAENIRVLASLDPDYLGFIEYGKSPRNVGADFSPPVIPDHVNRVGVFVDEVTPVIKAKAKRNGYTYIQLHGKETAGQCDELRQLGYGVIKVFSVNDDFNFLDTKPYVPVADLFLFDTKGKYQGGNGIPFNWNILRRYDQEVPFFLSGGLSEESLSGLDELEYMNVHGLDFNSGVEIAPGMKDIDKVRRIFEQLRVAKK